MKTDFRINEKPATEAQVLDFLSTEKPTESCDFISYRDGDAEVLIGWYFDKGWQLSRNLPDGSSYNSIRKYSPEEIIQWWHEQSVQPHWADQEKWEVTVLSVSQSRRRLLLLLSLGILLFYGLKLLSGEITLGAFLVVAAVLTAIYFLPTMAKLVSKLYASISKFNLASKRRAFAERFVLRPRLDDVAFLKECGLGAESLEARIALALRELIAEKAKIPKEVISGRCPWSEIYQLPGMDAVFFDDVNIVIALEEKLGFSIQDDIAEKKLFNPSVTGEKTILDFVLCVAEVVKTENPEMKP
ncbi:MAG: hypothetical protein GX561_04225 [Lentisphaerae bacterium]|nr:hypothetical protein [Lentisphaerota bacterium]